MSGKIGKFQAQLLVKLVFVYILFSPAVGITTLSQKAEDDWDFSQNDSHREEEIP